MSASELHKIQNAIILDLKSILLSSKDGLTERELHNEYRQLCGREIAYSCLGFNTLYDFLMDLVHKSIIRHQRRGNLVIYFAYDEKCTYELRNLVKGQTDRSHNIREQKRNRESTYRYNRQHNSVNGRSDYDHQQPNVPFYIQNQIRTILENSKTKSLSRSSFTRNFYQKYSGFINVNKYGFDSLRQLLVSLKHFIELGESPDDEFIIYLKDLSKQSEEKVVQDDAVVKEYKKLNDMTKLGDEIVENLKVLIKSFDNKGGLLICSIPAEYKKYFGSDLNVESIGYRSIVDLINDKLEDFVRTKRLEKYGDYLLFSKDSNFEEDVQDGDARADNYEEDEDEITYVNNLKQLGKEIRRLFKRDAINFDKKKLFQIIEFKELFQNKSGWKIHLKDYNCKTLDQLMMKLNDEKVLGLTCDENNNIFIKYRPDVGELEVEPVIVNESNQYSNGIRVVKNESEKAKFMINFFRDHVFYHETFDPYQVFEDFDLTKECDIFVSHITNPFEISIQIAKNIPRLNALMDDIENAYLGVGASHYNMEREYIQMGKYCAAVFPGDKNWHRCKILEIDDKKKLVRVSFIDYGGETFVPITDLKLLCKRFMNLPQQAILARLSNVDYMNIAGRRWSDKVTDYLLGLVTGKLFRARFDGTVFNNLSVTLYELDAAGKVTGCLNQRIIKEKQATEMKDKSIIRPFELSVFSQYLKAKIPETPEQKPNQVSTNTKQERQRVVLSPDVNNNSKSKSLSVSDDSIFDGSANFNEEVKNDDVSFVNGNKNNNNNVRQLATETKMYFNHDDYDDSDLSDASDQYFFVRPVVPQPIFSDNKDKETFCRLYNVILKKFKDDIKSGNGVDHDDKVNYILLSEKLMNKYLK
jgi:hypothetical protein